MTIEVVINPPRKFVNINFREIWQYRELLYFFMWRDIKIRYTQTILGILWVVIPPLMLAMVFTLFFGNLAKLPSDGIPYPLFSLTAIILWTLFSEGLTRSTNSMVTNAHIITKVYFPRLIVPISGVLSPLVDFSISIVVLILLMFYFAFIPSITMLFIPFFVFIAILTALSIGLWFSALNVKYRDFQYTIPFIIQIWFFASPVVYSSSIVPQQYQMLYGLNPMVGVIEGMRWAVLGTTPPTAMVFVSLIGVGLLFISGLFYFKKTEQYFADLV
jgi:lipopolysaccharide transport system permease protein